MKREISCLLPFAFPACKSNFTDQGAVVRVTNPSNVDGIAQLRVFASNQGTPGSLRLPDTATGTVIALPTDFSLIVPPSRAGLGGFDTSFTVWVPTNSPSSFGAASPSNILTTFSRFCRSSSRVLFLVPVDLAQTG